MLLMTTYHHGSLPDAVLRAGAEILEEQGPEAVTLREIARRTEVSHNAPYRHFPDRASLLAGLAGEGFDLLEQELAEVPARRVADACVAFALAHPRRFRLMFGGYVSFDDYPGLREKSGRVLELLRRALSATGAPPLAPVAAWALAVGLAHLILDGQFQAEQATAGGRQAFVDALAGTVRFAATPQRSA
jgi:AcrR family transcriptional regulator